MSRLDAFVKYYNAVDPFNFIYSLLDIDLFGLVNSENHPTTLHFFSFSIIAFTGVDKQFYVRGDPFNFIYSVLDIDLFGLVNSEIHPVKIAR